jgi:hypothetical protein
MIEKGKKKIRTGNFEGSVKCKLQAQITAWTRRPIPPFLEN